MSESDLLNLPVESIAKLQKDAIETFQPKEKLANELVSKMETMLEKGFNQVREATFKTPTKLRQLLDKNYRPVANNEIFQTAVENQFEITLELYLNELQAESPAKALDTVTKAFENGWKKRIPGNEWLISPEIKDRLKKNLQVWLVDRLVKTYRKPEIQQKPLSQERKIESRVAQDMTNEARLFDQAEKARAAAEQRELEITSLMEELHHKTFSWEENFGHKAGEVISSITSYFKDNAAIDFDRQPVPAEIYHQLFELYADREPASYTQQLENYQQFVVTHLYRGLLRECAQSNQFLQNFLKGDKYPRHKIRTSHRAGSEEDLLKWLMDVDHLTFTQADYHVRFRLQKILQHNSLLLDKLTNMDLEKLTEENVVNICQDYLQLVNMSNQLLQQSRGITDLPKINLTTRAYLIDQSLNHPNTERSILQSYTDYKDNFQRDSPVTQLEQSRATSSTPYVAGQSRGRFFTHSIRETDKLTQMLEQGYLGQTHSANFEAGRVWVFNADTAQDSRFSKVTFVYDQNTITWLAQLAGVRNSTTFGERETKVTDIPIPLGLAAACVPYRFLAGKDRQGEWYLSGKGGASDNPVYEENGETQKYLFDDVRDSFTS